MATGWTKLIEKVYGPIEAKKRWRQYKARVNQLPESYRTAIEALQRYSYYHGPGTAEGEMQLLMDLLDLFEQSAASGTPVREIVGEDPVEFAEAFCRNYGNGQWIVRERDRLIRDIARAEGEDTSEGPGEGTGDGAGNEGTSR